MVGLVGLEPMTSTMSTWRSSQLSYNPKRLFRIPQVLSNCKSFFGRAEKLSPAQPQAKGTVKKRIEEA